MRRRFAAIINPIAGSSGKYRVVRGVARALERSGGRLHVAVTSHAGEAPTLASQLASETDAILVVGGDGTVAGVVNGLVGRATPFAILSAGTENLVARELSMPTEPNDIAQLLLHGRSCSCDVGSANGTRFMVMVGVGFDAESVERLSKVRRGHITHWDYFWPIWRTFWSHGFPIIQVLVDGQCAFEGRASVLIGNMGRYSVGMRVLANARYDDGLLDVCVLPCSSRIAFTAHAMRIFMRRHVGRGGVIYRTGRSIQVRSPEAVPVQLDGDVGGTLPLVCSITPHAVRFLRHDGQRA